MLCLSLPGMPDASRENSEARAICVRPRFDTGCLIAVVGCTKRCGVRKVGRTPPGMFASGRLGSSGALAPLGV
eukprot:scaffold45672_cov36-Prasinocladus_malaysianus.AAC.1